MHQWLNESEWAVASVASGLWKMGIAEFLQADCFEIFTKDDLTGSRCQSFICAFYSEFSPQGHFLATLRAKESVAYFYSLEKKCTRWVKESSVLFLLLSSYFRVSELIIGFFYFGIRDTVFYLSDSLFLL